MKDKLRVLFATDFSSNSRLASRLLKLLQKSYKINLSLLYIIPSFWKDWFASGSYKQEAQQRLLSWQLEMIEKQDIKNLHVEYGNPAEEILQTALTTKSNLIVLGSKSISEGGRYKTGATIEAVVRHAKQSVLICKNENISKIICGIDGSASSTRAIKFAIDLCRRFSASLCIISALPHGNFNPLGLEEHEEKKLNEKFKVEQVNKLEQFLKDFDFSGISLKKCFPWGIPANTILDMAEDFNYDLIVVGAKGYSRLQHVLIGSTAEKVLRYAPCSLLVVR